MSALPWIGALLNERKSTDFGRLLGTIEKYISKRSTTHVGYLSVWSQTSIFQQDALHMLWGQIKDLERDGWSETGICRPYVEMEAQIAHGSLHVLPDVVPPPHRESDGYPLPSVVFRLFDYNDVPEGLTIPGCLSIERYLLDLSVTSIVDSYYEDPKICADMLLGLSMPKHVANSYIIAEVLFGRMLSLNVDRLPEMFFGSIWIFLMKKNPFEMPQILAQTVSIIYNNVESMNIYSLNIMVRWFSHALSNFHYRWNWQDWSECAEVSRDNPKAVFVAETLKLCVRLSYYEKITSTVPQVLSALYPSPPEFDFESSSTEANKVDISIKKKCSVGEMLDILESLFPDSDNVMERGDAKIEVFFSTLLRIGSNALSFTFAAITKYASVLKKIANGNRQRIVLLSVLRKCWRNNEQMMVVVVDKMIRMDILEHVSVINWIFGEDMVEDLSCFYVWEIIHRTIKLISSKLDSNQKQLEDVKDRYEFNITKASNSAMIGYDEDYEKISELSPNSIRQLEDMLDNSRDLQRRVLFVVFQRLVNVLNEHITRCMDENVQVETYWFKGMIERLQEVFFVHQEYTFQYLSNLKSLVFTNDVDERILNAFYSFSSLKD